MPGLVAFGEVQVLDWRLLRFLDEAVEQYHSLFDIDVEDDP